MALCAITSRVPASGKGTASRGRRRGALAWVISIVLHGLVVAALSFKVQTVPRGAPLKQLHEIGIEFAEAPTFRAELAADAMSGGGFIALASYSETSSAPPLLAGEAHLPGTGASQDRELSRASLSPERNSVTAETQLFGVTGKGNRFVYVFDRSASMAGYEGRPLAAAKRALIASLQKLEAVHQFQIVFYNEQLETMNLARGQSPGMVFADERGKRLAEQFIGGVYAHGGSGHLEALMVALRLRPDVIFLLTDANPPELTPEDLRRIRLLNKGTVISTIEFGAGSPSGRYNFLMQLADENAGQHAYIDVTRLPRQQ